MVENSNGNGTDLYIVRHGSTSLNNQTDMSDDRVRGWTNVPLSAEGIADAHKVAADLIPFEINLILSSDLHRAMQTAEIIGQLNHAPVQPLPLLRSWNLGELQGRTSKEAAPIIRHYACNVPHVSVPGGGESFYTFSSRAFRGLSHGIAEATSGRTVCIVTHHRTERLYFAWRDGGFKSDFSIRLSTFLAKGEAPGEVSELSIPNEAFNDSQESPSSPSNRGARLGMASNSPSRMDQQGGGKS